jgi:hypothetical protein
MRRFILVIFTLLTACSNLAAPALPPSPIVPLLTSTDTVEVPAPTASPSVVAPSPTTITPAPSSIPATPIPLPLSPDTYTVQFHPEDGLYVGDQVSMEVISPPGVDLKGKSLQVQLGGPQGTRLGPVSFAPFGLGNRYQATLLWAWNTQGLAPGRYDLAFSVLPSGPYWTQTILLQPAGALPPAERLAHWASVQSKCCLIYYITGTAAERDIEQIMTIADSQAADASQRMGVAITTPIVITLLPRVLGNGGFTAQDISVSYLDRNYGGNEFAIVLHHEMIHALDARLGGDLRPTILEEGLAVYMSGGHFRPEPIIADAAALLQIHSPLPAEAAVVSATPQPGVTPTPGSLGWFLPLSLLADNFYASQHETGYLEAAALVAYMVERWGWDGFNKFYRDIHNQSNGSQADAISAALSVHFAISLQDLQKDFLDRLRQSDVTPANLADVQETVALFDTMRRYQELLDPSAYFRSAWLLDNNDMRKRGIVADYLRHPSAPDNLALETMLIEANQDWQAFNYSGEEQVLGVVNAVLDGVESQQPDPFDVDPLALDYQAIVQVLLKAGYQPQRISVSGDTAQAWVTASGPLLLGAGLRRVDGTWIAHIGKGEDLTESLSPTFENSSGFAVLGVSSPTSYTQNSGIINYQTGIIYDGWSVALNIKGIPPGARLPGFGTKASENR